jgi:teichuronic acid biosynthesis protein TuaE
VPKMRLEGLSLLKIEKIICYLVIMTGFLGSALLAVNVGNYNVSLFRILFILLWAAIVVRILLAGEIRVPRGKVRWFLLFLVLWFIYAVFSLAWALSFVDAVKNIFFLFIGISLVIFICYYFRSQEELSKLYYVFLGAFYLLLIIGIAEYLTGCHLPVSRYYNFANKFIPTSVFHNENDFATFISLYVPFGICTALYARNRLLKISSILSILGACLLIVVIGARSSMLALFIEFIVLFFLLTNIKQKSYLLGVTVLAIIMLHLFSFPLLDNLFTTVTEQVNSLAIQYELQTGSVNTRLNLIKNGLVFLVSTVGFGVGAGNIEYWMSNCGQYNTAGISNMHNWWMEIMTSYGIIIFIGYLLFYFGIIYNLLIKRKRNNRMFSDTLILSFSGFIIACIGPSSFISMNIQWLLFGIAVAYINSVSQLNDKKH